MASAHTTRRRALAGSLAPVAAAMLLAACGDNPPKRDAAGAIDKPGDTRLLKLRVGDCVANLRHSLDNDDGEHNGVPQVKAVNCSQSHDAEILVIAPLGGGAWPGYEIVDGEAARGRQQLQPRLLRIKQADGPLTLVTFRPSQERWEFEHQHVIQYLALYDGKPQRGHAPK
jgi:hypothetical protein